MRDRRTDESPRSVGTATVRVQERRTPPSGWLADSLQALAELDDEIVEDGLPEIKPSVHPVPSSCSWTMTDAPSATSTHMGAVAAPATTLRRTSPTGSSRSSWRP